MSDELAKQRSARQRKHAIAKAKNDSLVSRRAALRKQLNGLDAALDQPHLSAEHRERLIKGKAELAVQLRQLGQPSTREKLEGRLFEIESQLANARGLTSQEMLNLLAEHSQLLEDVQSLG